MHIQTEILHAYDVYNGARNRARGLERAHTAMKFRAMFFSAKLVKRKMKTQCHKRKL